MQDMQQLPVIVGLPYSEKQTDNTSAGSVDMLVICATDTYEQTTEPNSAYVNARTTVRTSHKTGTPTRSVVMQRQHIRRTCLLQHQLAASVLSVPAVASADCC